jgi:hypothetical protein
LCDDFSLLGSFFSLQGLSVIFVCMWGFGMRGSRRAVGRILLDASRFLRSVFCPHPNQTLKRRYFLLRKKALMYFEGENAAIDSSLGKIVLSAALSVVKAPIDPEEPMSKYGFMVCHHHLVYCDYCRLF